MMSHDWAADIKKCAANCGTAAVDRIVNYRGIALQSRDGAFVACHDKVERDRVRDCFLKKKLGHPSRTASSSAPSWQSASG